MKKKFNNIYNLDGLMIHKKSWQVIKVINILRIFSSLHFFKIDYYPFDYKKYLIFYNELVKYAMCYSFIKFYKGIYIFFLKILNQNKFLKKNLGFEIQFLLICYQKYILKIIKDYIKKFKHFNKLKFKFIKLKKINYLQKYKFGKRIKKLTIKENLKMQFFSNLLKNEKNLKIIHHYVHSKFKKSFKKKVMYLKRKKTLRLLKKQFSNNLIFKKIRKKKTKKILYKKLRLNFKGNFLEKKESAINLFKILSKDKKKIIGFLKNRKKKFWRKYFLIKKYKRKILKRKKRTGILHFRMYYSNYYITLTDLSHNVIFSCSAGSVSDTNNKKTKMSNVVSLPIFYRIIFFLRAFKIKNLKFVFRNRIDKIFFNALHFFKKRGYKIKSFSFVKKAPHHLGQRKQKPRRI